MRVVIGDFENFFDSKSGYTLKRMSTEAYIRDSRFEADGAAIKWSKETNPVWYDDRELRYILKNEDWSDTMFAAWHCQFDGLILSHHYGIRPKMMACPMSMARLALGNHISASLDSVRHEFGIPSKTTPYDLMDGKHWSEMDQATRDQVATGAIDEVNSIYQIFGMLLRGNYPKGYPFPAEELEVIDTTIKMFTEPELIGDGAIFAKVWQDETTRKTIVLQRLGLTEGDVQSADRFAELLRECGVEPEMKPGKPNGDGSEKLIYAFAKTDPFMEELQQDEDPEVRALAEARLGAKSTLLQTRAETLGWMASRGPLPIYLRYAGAHTSRWSGGDNTNFQNWTNGSEINTAIVAPDGYELWEPDASQIECIAEGQLVLTDSGLKSIEKVLLTDRVWDGVEWVSHDGVICKGTKPVISYQGLTATPEHIVYVRSACGEEKMEMRVAAACGRDLEKAVPPPAIRQAAVRKPILRWLQDLRSAWHRVLLQIGPRCGDLGCGEPAPSELHRLRDRPRQQRWALRAWQSQIIDAARKCQQSAHDFLGAYVRWGCCAAGFQTVTPGMRLRSRSNQGAGRQGDDWRADHRAVQARALGYLRSVSAEVSGPLQEARVYDIVNAGPRHRFTVSGVIVSNCRLLNYCAGQTDKVEEFRQGLDPYVSVASAFYKKPINKKDHPVERQLGKIVELQAGYMSGGEKIRQTVRVKSGGKILLTIEEGVQARNAYRDTHPAVVRYWRTADWLLTEMYNWHSHDWGPLRIVCDWKTGKRRSVLPNGIQLIYDTLEWFVDHSSGDEYWRLKTHRGWAKMYSGKLVENVIQALARVVVSQAMLRLKKLGYRCKNTKHDSLWLLVPKDDRREEHEQVILGEMSRSPTWLPDVPLSAEFKHRGERYA